jgi:hypothetical protein
MVWQWVSNLARASRARAAAVSRIAPLIEGSKRRLGGISSNAWSDPYIVGLLIMLITIVARASTGRLSSDVLCSVQQQAWQRITRQPSSVVGEQVLSLSRDRDPEFERGCRTALHFSTLVLRNANIEDEEVGALWADAFDRNFAAYSRGDPSTVADEPS